ncbi:threonine-phosphate decarboxylase [Megamonas hypermegale]|uniref:threonine-phosphate decarboxylase CobD n=1 Tax=Megamonas hypermegale TaxID=158847 RepID=UPI000B3A362A|nr:threonine-phosphate decarboxylase CobD [Megamonas hypermegale]OUO41390.1 threonine-phosphate decarboxylase [Megamonas hypermegale]HJG08105.1 threonine-phosphate decarboxylase CobD [Megamonas hypermegale]
MQKFEHGGDIKSVIRENNLNEIMDFSANINPYGLSSNIKNAILADLDNIIHYPQPNAEDLRKKIGETYNIAGDKIIVGNGAVEIIYTLCHILKPKNVLIVSPGFSEYERAARSAGADIHYAMLDEKLDFNSPMRDIIVNIKGNDLLFIGNPNNPTGTLYMLEDMELLIEHAENNGCFVVVDESFMDFIKTSEAFSVLPLVEKYHNLLVLHSLTKFYAIPGLRLGFAATDHEVLDPLYAAKDIWNVNSLAQAAGMAALDDKKYQRRSRTYTRTEINYLYEELSTLDKLKVYEPTVNFILVNISKTGLTATQLREKLLKYNIIIRNCANYPGLDENYVRFAVRTREENDELVDALTEILE